MTTLDKEELKRKFKEYVNGFDMKDPNIERKYYHSLRVMDFAENIGKSINLDDNDIEIAIVGGLLHDYGRFPQWERYNTYSDVDSIDHGNLGVSLLFNENEILNFYNNVKNFDELYDAIKYHNKYDISPTLSEHNKELSYIVRDADKLDIFDIFVNNILSLNETNDPISKEVSDAFFRNESVSYKDVRNPNDDIILKLAMLYDLKYKYSKNYVIDNNIIDKLYSKLNNKDIFDKYFKHIKEYLGI